MAFNDQSNIIQNFESSQSNTSSESEEFASDAIAELVKKRRTRLQMEKKIKNLKRFKGSEDDGPSSKKALKFNEIFMNENIPLNIDSSSFLLAADSSSVSQFSNLALSPSWNQLSTTSFINQKLASSFPIIHPKKTIGSEFAKVYGRLSILTTQKYTVTVGEITRRIFGMEDFSFSLLASFLRRAKMPASTKALHDELQECGIAIEKGKRRTSRLTLFGGLLEGEAVQLGKDFGNLLSTQFPHQAIAHSLVEELRMEEEEKKKMRLEELKAARKFVNDFLGILSEDSSPISSEYPTQTLPDAIQNELTSFSIMTHGFGIFAVKAVMEMYGKILDAQILEIS